MNEQYKAQYKALGNYGTLGLEIVLSIALGFFGGRWLDGKLGTEPVLSVLGFFFGTAAAVKAIVRTWKDMQRVAEREEREQGNPAPLFESRAEVAEKKKAEKQKAEEEAEQRSTRERVAPIAAEVDQEGEEGSSERDRDDKP